MCLRIDLLMPCMYKPGNIPTWLLGASVLTCLCHAFTRQTVAEPSLTLSLRIVLSASVFDYIALCVVFNEAFRQGSGTKVSHLSRLLGRWGFKTVSGLLE